MSIRVERIKEILKPSQYKKFMKWMDGQTIRLFEDGTKGIYEHDLMRWIKKLPVVD